MKINFVKKLALISHLVLSVLFFLMLAIGCVSPQLLEAFVSLKAVLIVGIVLGVIFVMLSVALGMMLFAQNAREDERGFITVESLETGKVKVAVAAVDQMIRQAVRGVEGISEMKADIENNDDAISIDTSIIVKSGLHIPTVTASMQNAIRGYIERNCGVAVREVSVSIRMVDDGEQNNKRGRRKAVAEMPGIEKAPEILPEVNEFKLENDSYAQEDIGLDLAAEDARLFEDVSGEEDMFAEENASGTEDAEQILDMDAEAHVDPEEDE